MTSDDLETMLIQFVALEYIGIHVQHCSRGHFSDVCKMWTKLTIRGVVSGTAYQTGCMPDFSKRGLVSFSGIVKAYYIQKLGSWGAWCGVSRAKITRSISK